MPKDFIIYTDGGARGNPGPAAYGYVVAGTAGEVLIEKGAAIGETTNNVAEYTAPIEALKALRKRIGKGAAADAVVEIRMDSELVVKQMNREYKVKAENVRPLFVELWNQTLDFSEVVFVHIRREKNQHADRLVNEALDRDEPGLGL